MNGGNTPRESVLNSDEYVKCLSDAEGYYEAFNTVKDTASIYFTAQPYFTETTTEWAKTLQELVTTNKYSSVEEAMNHFKTIPATVTVPPLSVRPLHHG